ncbi:MAG: NifU family protein [Candidatus Poseidoniaceae archaeon]|jgi:Fe-S cluster biogenesis protein NfuA|nr:NifU family protein [Candidatus Poseidoniaceae archaeon]
MTAEDLVAKYAAEAKVAIQEEALRRIAETTDPVLEERLRNTSLLTLIDSSELVPAILSRLGEVRAALDGHGGGISVSSIEVLTNSENLQAIDLVLDLTGACISCGAAPGTLDGIKTDLETYDEIQRVQFSKNLLDTFDELGREFILAHGSVTFV